MITRFSYLIQSSTLHCTIRVWWASLRFVCMLKHLNIFVKQHLPFRLITIATSSSTFTKFKIEMSEKQTAGSTWSNSIIINLLVFFSLKDASLSRQLIMMETALQFARTLFKFYGIFCRMTWINYLCVTKMGSYEFSFVHHRHFVFVLSWK